MRPGSLWHLVEHEVFDPTDTRFNSLFVLDVQERIAARTGKIFYHYDRKICDAGQIFEERWHEYLGWDRTGGFPFRTLMWKRRIEEEFDEEALEKRQEK
jgi:hypothetical protein